MNAPSPQESKYQRDMIAWISEAVAEGQRFLEQQYGYEDIDQAISYIQGDQRKKNKPEELSNYFVNRLGKCTTDIVAAMTDIKPLFNFTTQNDSFQEQSRILNKLTKGWWLNNFIDLKLGGAIQLALPSGCSYLHLVFDQDAQGGNGELDVVPLDCRDVLPIRPAQTISIQDGMGVIIRSVQTVNYLKSKYPSLAHRIVSDANVGQFTPRSTAFSRMISTVLSPVQQALRPKVGKGGFAIPAKEVYTIYLKDDTRNTGTETIQMGYGRSKDGELLKYSWSYDVEQGEMLYPRGRCIVASRDVIFYDGPNVYWHGKFPVVKLPMDMSFVYPNSYLSKSVIGDLIPLQDIINDILNGITDAVAQALKPGVIADTRTVPRAVLEKLNTRKPGYKLLTNPAMGQGVGVQEPRQLPQYIFEVFQMVVNEIEYLSGSQDLSNLAKVKQIPAFESIEAILQAMTPATRMRGRLMECALRELADMVKFGFFQFYDAPRRISILGADGLAMEDFDFDPATLIPDTKTEGYVGMTKIQRAVKHAHNFTFNVTPNSMLEVALVTKKMLYLQLRRGGDLDWKTFMEAMEVPNLDQVQQRLQEEMQQKANMAAQAQAQVEMAKMQQGGMLNVTREGRPPTAQTPPHQEVKGDMRPVTSES